MRGVRGLCASQLNWQGSASRVCSSQVRQGSECWRILVFMRGLRGLCASQLGWQGSASCVCAAHKCGRLVLVL